MRTLFSKIYCRKLELKRKLLCLGKSMGGFRRIRKKKIGKGIRKEILVGLLYSRLIILGNLAGIGEKYIRERIITVHLPIFLRKEKGNYQLAIGQDSDQRKLYLHNNLDNLQ